MAVTWSRLRGVARAGSAGASARAGAQGSFQSIAGAGDTGRALGVYWAGTSQAVQGAP